MWMNGAMLGTMLMAAAIWVALPDPHQQLRRLDSPIPGSGGKLVGWLHGKEGALPLKVRILLGLVLAALLFAYLPPGPGGVAWGVASLGVVVIGGARIPLKRRLRAAGAAELADTVELLAVCLSAGAPMRHALEVVADVSEADTESVLARVSGQLTMGVSEQDAWLELAEDEIWGPVARDVARSARSGTSLVEVLHVHAEEARLVAQERALQKARTAGVRSVVPLMACFLPAFVLVGVLPIIAGLLGGLLSP